MRDNDDIISLVGRLADGDSIECAWRGCHDIGLHYLRRVSTRGKSTTGLYCDEHERQEGDKNLAQAAKHSRGL